MDKYVPKGQRRDFFISTSSARDLHNWCDNNAPVTHVFSTLVVIASV